MLAGPGQQCVNHRVVVLALPGFELLPVDRHLNRVDVHVLHGRPYFRKHARPGAGVVRLCPQHKERSIVYEQGEASVLLHNARDRALLDLGLGGARGQQNGKNGRNHPHGVCSYLAVKTTISMPDQSNCAVDCASAAPALWHTGFLL
jgi:hypothetical protein